MLGTEHRKGMFKTSLAEDLKLLNEPEEPLNWHQYLAYTHRVTQKEVLKQQIRLLSVLLEIMLRVKAFKQKDKMKKMKERKAMEEAGEVVAEI